MARTQLVSELMTRVRQRGSYESAQGEADPDYYETGSELTNTTLIGFLDTANTNLHTLYKESDQDFLLTRQVYSVSSTASYDLPSDYDTARSVQWRPDSSSGWLPLRRASVDDDVWTSGDPVAYRVVQDVIELVPASGGSGQFRLSYVPEPTRLSSSLQSVVDHDGFCELLVLRATHMALDRDGRDTRSVDVDIALETERVRRSALHRDRGTPKRMRDPRASRPRRVSWRP